MKHRICLSFAGCILTLSAGSAAGQADARSIAPSTGKAMCSALTPADFTKAGVPVQSLSQANLDGNDGAYCVYQSKAGKVEFDIFFLAGKTPQEISGTEKTVLGEGGAKYEHLQLPGADDVHPMSVDVGDPLACAARRLVERCQLRLWLVAAAAGAQAVEGGAQRGVCRADAAPQGVGEVACLATAEVVR